MQMKQLGVRVPSSIPNPIAWTSINPTFSKELPMLFRLHYSLSLES